MGRRSRRRECAQLTTFGRACDSAPRWSPDGARILISATVNGQLDLYLVDVAGGALTRLTDDGEDEIAPAWSHDGAAVMFGARRSGTWQVMRHDDRRSIAHAADHRWRLCRASRRPTARRSSSRASNAPGVWTMPAGGGEARLLVPGVRAAETVNWRVDADTASTTSAPPPTSR